MDSGVQKPIGLSEAEITAFTDKALFESALARKSEPKNFHGSPTPQHSSGARYQALSSQC